MTSSIDKRKKTQLIKYGNEIYQQTEDFKNKREKTCLEKYGVKTPLHSPEIRKKIYEKLNKKKISDSIVKSREKEKVYSGEYYSIEETKNLCETINEKYFGSGKYRILIKEEPKLYFSILKYSKEFENCKNGTNFRGRVKYLLGHFKRIQCPYCGNYLKYDCGSRKIMYICHNCKLPKIRSEEYCYLNDLNYEEEKKRISEIIKNAQKNYKGPNVNSKECFIKKYGKEEGLKRYLSHIKNVVDSNHRYSNISKEFFEKLIEKTNLDKSLCFYAENEKRFDLSEEEQKTLNRKCIYVDFLVGNKIIEYNGLFWHEKDRRIEDFNRKIFLEKMGYEVLTVWDKTKGELERAINFINKDRFQILTSEGYSNFNGIAKHLVSKTLLFTLENNKTIEVSEEHRFFINHLEYFAKDLKIGDCLEIKNRILERIIDIKIIEKESEVYDILETKNHTYYANDILNHNCEFIGSSYTLIDADILKNMVPEEPILKWDNRLDVFVEPIKDHKYIMAVDPAKGGLDAFAVQIIDVTSFPFGQVADAQIFKCNYQIMPEFLNEWGNRYNNAYMIIENNEGAGTFIANMMHLDFEYENLFFTKKDNGKFSKEPGFRTTTKTRTQILETFKHFVDNKRLIIRDKKTINELYSFIIKDNKYQADDGSHDDLVMSMALAFVPFISSRNFEDMKELVKKLYSDEDLKDTSFSDYLVIGNFDISVDEEESIAGKPYDDRYNYSYEYYSRTNNF